jgi:hypothetical protein
VNWVVESEHGRCDTKGKKRRREELTIEKDSATGRLELITEFDRRFVTEAYVNSLARADRGLSLHAADGARWPAFSREETVARRAEVNTPVIQRHAHAPLRLGRCAA